ncbi:hypothetical protein K2P56_00380 [Patescibacteria group bacterium]|nr:hypothetical protein [Patescibacteria group bacterium]
MARERERGYRPSWDVLGTAAGVTLATWAFRDQGAAVWVGVSTLPAVVAGLLNKRKFAYSVLIGSGGSAVTGDGLAYFAMSCVAAFFGSVAYVNRTKHTNYDHRDDGEDIH